MTASNLSGSVATVPVTPPAGPPPSSAWQRARRATNAAAIAATLALLAAWQIPPRLDWARYSPTLAKFAAARLGRDVTIGGQVHLTLLPEVALTAANVGLADRGDGVSARLGALRLQVAFWPLLAGRIVPRDLVLDDPVMIVPWPLPQSPVAAPPLPPGFAARTEGGELHIGTLRLRSVNAELHADPDTGALRAQGTAIVQESPARFTALIGAAGRDGVRAIAVSLDGLDALRGTGGTFHGRLRGDGALEGSLQARGPDLSLLVPGPAEPWRLSGPLRAAGGALQAPSLLVQLAGSPGDAAATVRILPPGRVDLALTLGSVALGTWTGPLVRPGLAVPLHLDLRAQAATWRGATLRDPHIVLVTGGVAPHVSASALLPGTGALTLEGTLAEGATALSLSGPLTLTGPDVPATLGWLAAQVPGLPKDVFRALPRPGTLAGRLDLSEDAVNLSNLALHLGDSVISGRANLTLAGRPAVRAKLTADHVDLDALPDSFSVPGALAGDFAGFDADLDLTASAARMRGTSLTNFAVKLLGSAGGLQLRRCAADLPGLHGEGAVAIGTDGTITDGHLELTAQDAALLPRAWRTPDSFWQGPAHVAVTANGPPQQILAELRADIGDLRAEAEGRVDAIAQHLSATVTLRHPGAPRLLETLGVPGAQRWLDTGSVSFQAHLAAWPGHVEAQDFSLSAAALHLGGQIAADFTGPVPSLTGQIEAANLTLPRADGRGDAALPFASLGDWQADLHMHAGLVSWGAETIATGLNAQVTKAGGIVLTDLAGASVAGGTLVGQAVIDSTALSPAIVLRFGLINAALDNLPALPPFPLTNGSVSLVADLAASGYSPAALLATAAGDVHASVRDAALAGIDLAALRKALVLHAPRLRAALQSALSSGTTTSLAGDIDATLRDGALTLRAAQLASDAGSIETTGSVDLAERSTDLALALTPAVSAPPVVNLFLFGPWPGARHPGNLRAALAWAAGSRK